MSSTSALRVSVCVCEWVCASTWRQEQNPFLASPLLPSGAPLLMPFLAGSWKSLITDWVILGRGRERDVPHLAEQQAARRPSPPRDPRQRGPGRRSPTSRSTRTGRNIYPTAVKMKGRAEKGLFFWFFFFQSPDINSNSAGQDQPLIICFQSPS